MAILTIFTGQTDQKPWSDPDYTQTEVGSSEVKDGVLFVSAENLNTYNTVTPNDTYSDDRLIDFDVYFPSYLALTDYRYFNLYYLSFTDSNNRCFISGSRNGVDQNTINLNVDSGGTRILNVDVVSFVDSYFPGDIEIKVRSVVTGSDTDITVTLNGADYGPYTVAGWTPLGKPGARLRRDTLSDNSRTPQIRSMGFDPDQLADFTLSTNPTFGQTTTVTTTNWGATDPTHVDITGPSSNVITLSLTATATANEYTFTMPTISETEGSTVAGLLAGAGTIRVYTQV